MSSRPAGCRRCCAASPTSAQGYGLQVANIFHAGDGNLHPLVLYNMNDPAEQEKAEAAGADILKFCVEVGGCLTGEHGVGIEKRDLMAIQFSEVDLAAQMRVKSVFDPDWLLNPGQGLPARGPAGAGVSCCGDGWFDQNHCFFPGATRG